jgi:hypothetical protein
LHILEVDRENGLCKEPKKYHDLQGNCSDNDTFLNDPGDSGDWVSRFALILL